MAACPPEATITKARIGIDRYIGDSLLKWAVTGTIVRPRPHFNPTPY